MNRIIPLVLLLILSAFPAHAFDKLGIPVKCSIGKECFIQNYYDHDYGKGYHDYACQNMSYDGHKGTDFRVRDYVAMRQGVEVIASANGVVKARRDGMVDVNIKSINSSLIKGRECGNGVILTHEDGYETQYCHLKKGSVVVKKGQKVKKGDVLGDIGMSGMAAFPHVELQVRKGNMTIDPFMVNGHYFEQLPALNCKERNKLKEHMWDEAAAEMVTPYKSSALLNAWFTSSEPEAENAREGRFLEPSISRDAEMIVFWIDVMGLQLRDDLKISILDPEGNKVVDDHEVISRNRALYFRYLGKKSRNRFWKPGTYVGRVTLERDGTVIFSQDRELSVL